MCPWPCPCNANRQATSDLPLRCGSGFLNSMPGRPWKATSLDLRRMRMAPRESRSLNCGDNSARRYHMPPPPPPVASVSLFTVRNKRSALTDRVSLSLPAFVSAGQHRDEAVEEEVVRAV